MNLLQQFMKTCNDQTLASNLIQEAVTLPGPITVYGTFGDPQLMPVMTRQGYQEHLVTPLKVAADQFSVAPTARITITRPLTSRTFFVQVVDYTNPVVYTFILTDREL